MRINDARREYIRWLLTTRDLSDHTIRAYRGDVSALEAHVGQEFKVQEIDQEQLISFLEGQRLSGLSAASIRRRAAGLRGFSRWLTSRGFIETDPWIGAAIASDRSRRLPRTLQSRQLNQLFESMNKAADKEGSTALAKSERNLHHTTTFLAVSLMVTTGTRAHETVKVRCEDIDLAQRSIRILGKGRRERQVFLVNDWITSFVARFLDLRSRLNVDHSCLLFNRHLAPLSTAALRARLRNAARAAGLRTRITPHMLRHTAATQLIEAGVDIRYIQRLLGHASLSTTEIYTHVSDPSLKQAVTNANVLEKVLSKSDN